MGYSTTAAQRKPARAGEARAGLLRSGRPYFADDSEDWAGAAG
jgi:hypothetical protein